MKYLFIIAMLTMAGCVNTPGTLVSTNQTGWINMDHVQLGGPTLVYCNSQRAGEVVCIIPKFEEQQ